jgi:DNA-entry nuclease
MSGKPMKRSKTNKKINNIKKLIIALATVLFLFISILSGNGSTLFDNIKRETGIDLTAFSLNTMDYSGGSPESNKASAKKPFETLNTESIPPYSDIAFYPVNGNNPSFTDEDIGTKAFDRYSPKDRYGRCGQAEACLGKELMPKGGRKDISSIKPTGWQQNFYSFVSGGAIYNRSHLIGHQLAGKDTEENLITGTRYMNVEGMLPFENMVADYIKETGNHVLYRVTPVFDEKNLLASGVQMEALSVEDKGKGISFNVFCYNVQPGIAIDYSTGENSEVTNSE